MSENDKIEHAYGSDFNDERRALLYEERDRKLKMEGKL